MQKSITTVSASELVMTEEGAWVLELEQRDFLVVVPCSSGCGSPGDCTSHNRQFPSEENANCAAGSPLTQDRGCWVPFMLF